MEGITPCPIEVYNDLLEFRSPRNGTQAESVFFSEIISFSLKWSDFRVNDQELLHLKMSEKMPIGKKSARFRRPEVWFLSDGPILDAIASGREEHFRVGSFGRLSSSNGTARRPPAVVPPDGHLV